MKKLVLLTTLVVMWSLLSFSQSNQNDIINDLDESFTPTKMLTFTNQQLIQNRMSEDSTRYVFNVRIHFVETNATEVEKEFKALDIVGVLNHYFNENGIFFKYLGFTSIHSNSYHDYSDINLSESFYLDYRYGSTDAIDIFIYNLYIDNHGNPRPTRTGWCHSHLENTPPYTVEHTANKYIWLKYDHIPEFINDNPSNSDLKGGTLLHEIGHYFGLYHTFQLWYMNSATLTWETLGPSATNCGRREENLDGSEATMFGDLIADTNPDRARFCYWDPGAQMYDPNTCTINWADYHDDVNCNKSIDQDLFDPPVQNFMSYYHSCRSEFSQGQKDRMRTYIHYFINNPNCYNNGYLTTKLNTIQSLYEPYEVGTPVVLQITYTNQQDLAPGVPYYWIWYRHFGNKFQKGFDYDFFAFDPDNNTFTYDYSKQIFERPLDDWSYRAVRINQISQNIVVFEDRQNPVPGPVVTSSTIFSSDINTNNQSVRDLNEQESNDPNLYQNLESQKLHIIIKHLDNGEQDVKTIIKD